MESLPIELANERRHLKRGADDSPAGFGEEAGYGSKEVTSLVVQYGLFLSSGGGGDRKGAERQGDRGLPGMTAALSLPGLPQSLQTRAPAHEK